ncbi:hypothetical protein, conserved [Trypanosoma brucei brucei TREU927]|uniref:Uncharacterized protein n=1 Tax=Trypanosoma brucei brucei (strain 927/4 GUTat10.1) TaxID=185431 RepID=Q38CT2_TRYB2|nr:hypothetical protein, conserved [Trypanosoma brucei brucei TREU927]EAN77388.1 hypothetical protein, conserved [Trypanosoma brucei brucei TREU927]
MNCIQPSGGKKKSHSSQIKKEEKCYATFTRQESFNSGLEGGNLPKKFKSDTHRVTRCVNINWEKDIASVKKVIGRNLGRKGEEVHSHYHKGENDTILKLPYVTIEHSIKRKALLTHAAAAVAIEHDIDNILLIQLGKHIYTMELPQSTVRYFKCVTAAVRKSVF